MIIPWTSASSSLLGLHRSLSLETGSSGNLFRPWWKRCGTAGVRLHLGPVIKARARESEDDGKMRGTRGRGEPEGLSARPGKKEVRVGRASRLVPSRMKQRPAQPPVARRSFVFIPKRIPKGPRMPRVVRRQRRQHCWSTSNHILPSRSLITLSAQYACCLDHADRAESREKEANDLEV